MAPKTKIVKTPKVIIENGPMLPKKKRARRTQPLNRGGIPRAYPTRVTGGQTQNVRLYGRDRFAHIADVGNKAAGAVILDVPVTLNAFPRLSSLANAFQRYRIRKLSFTICPMSSTEVTGGFAACFIPDAKASLPPDQALEKILSTQPNAVFKAWQEAKLVAPSIPDLFYTEESGEARLYCPGRLAVAVESKVQPIGTNAAPLTVYCNWDVEFSKPGLEGEEDDGIPSLKCPGYLVLQKDSYGISVKTKKQNGGFKYSVTPSDVFPGIKKNIIYRLPQAVAPYLVTGQVEENKHGNWEFIRWSTENAGTTQPTEYDRIWFVESDGTAVEVVSKEEQDLLFQPAIVPVGESFGLKSVGLEYLSRPVKVSGPADCYPPFKGCDLSSNFMQILNVKSGKPSCSLSETIRTTFEDLDKPFNSSEKMERKEILSLKKLKTRLGHLAKGLDSSDSDLEVLE